MKNKNNYYYSTREVAKKLNINLSLLMRKIRKGEIKAQRVGWVWIISKDQVDQLIADRAGESPDS